MVTSKVTVITRYYGNNNVIVETKRDKDEKGYLKPVIALITIGNGELHLTPRELTSLAEILNKIVGEIS